MRTFSPISTAERVFAALDTFEIEIPSWGFANTGTRFGKFIQPGAAASIEEKFADAAEVHRLTGITPRIALHALWDLPHSEDSVREIHALKQQYGVRAGSINPNLFQQQEYKFGSLCNPDPAIRARALQHVVECIRLGQLLDSRDVSLWLPDGSNYPGTQSFVRRIDWLKESLAEAHAELAAGQRLLVEYKPFEPAFYHTDIADWGMAYTLAKEAGPQALVLVDTGHHALGTNIEQIVAWLLHLGALGGFHFNDRKYADDDLTLASIDPYQVFRIFHEIQAHTSPSNRSAISFMIDQSHNLKGKMEATVQTVCVAQELYARAALIDHGRLTELQDACALVEAEELYRGAFFSDIRELVRAWRESKGIPADPLDALCKSGYVNTTAAVRVTKDTRSLTSYA